MSEILIYDICQICGVDQMDGGHCESCQAAFDYLSADVVTHLSEGHDARELLQYSDDIFTVIGTGSNRRVYDLGDGMVLKLDNGNRQSITEYLMTEAFPTEIRTEVYSTEGMSELGVIIAEAVTPFYEYVTGVADETLNNGDDYSELFVEVEHYDAADGDSSRLALYNVLPDWLIQTLYEFELTVAEYGINDMYADNLGFREDGTLVALDLGYGSSDINSNSYEGDDNYE